MKGNEKRKLILITGSNKGIGYTIIRELMKENCNYSFILTSRNEKLGHQSYAQLLNEFPSYKNYLFYYQLDITKKESIEKIVSYIKENFEKIDYLVNNAGIGYSGIPKKDVITTNVFGTFNVTEEFLKNNIINKNGKIINIGSELGSYRSTGKFEKKIREAKNSNDLLEISNLYYNDEWEGNPYGFSKLIIHLYSKFLGKRKNVIDLNIGSYSIIPGWCRTDMGGSCATYSAEHGASIAIKAIKVKDGINSNIQGKMFDNSSTPKEI